MNRDVEINEVDDQEQWEEPTETQPSRPLLMVKSALLLVALVVVGATLLLVLWLLVSITLSLIDAL